MQQIGESDSFFPWRLRANAEAQGVDQVVRDRRDFFEGRLRGEDEFLILRIVRPQPKPLQRQSEHLQRRAYVMPQRSNQLRSLITLCR